MTISRATFVANITTAIVRKSIVEIGGGHFDSNDMRDLRTIVDAPPAAFVSSFPAKPCEPETELPSYTRVRETWAGVAADLQSGSRNLESRVSALAVAVTCVHAEALSFRRRLAYADAGALRLNDKMAEAEGRLEHCGLVAKFRDGGEPVAFLACVDSTWREISRDLPDDARARIINGETVCNATAQFRLATGAELMRLAVVPADRVPDLVADVTEWKAEARLEHDRANREAERANMAEARELGTFAAIKPVMAELSGLTLGMLPPGAYGGALANAYCDAKRELGL